MRTIFKGVKGEKNDLFATEITEHTEKSKNKEDFI